MEPTFDLADTFFMRTREPVRHSWEGLTKDVKKRFFTKKGWRKRAKKAKKVVKKVSYKISLTPVNVLILYSVIILGSLIVASAIIAMVSQNGSKTVTVKEVPYAASLTDYSTYFSKTSANHVDPGLPTVAGVYKKTETTVGKEDTSTSVDPAVKEALKYPELSSVTLVSGLTLPIPVTWSPVAAAGTDLAFSREDPNVVVSFSDLGSLKDINQGILDSTKKTLESQGSILTPFKTSAKGVISFTASQGDRQVEVYLMIVSGRGLMVTLTYEGKANSASSEVAWLVDRIVK